MLRVFCQH